jgi:hypothetical protein
VDNLPHATFQGEDAQLQAAISPAEHTDRADLAALPPAGLFSRDYLKRHASCGITDLTCMLIHNVAPKNKACTSHSATRGEHIDRSSERPFMQPFSLKLRQFAFVAFSAQIVSIAGAAMADRYSLASRAST